MFAVAAYRIASVSDRFQPDAARTASDPFQMRFLTGGALLGLAIAVPSPRHAQVQLTPGICPDCEHTVWNARTR